MSLVRDLVVLHHGTITVESEEGKGTLFIVNFPVLRNSYAEEEIEESLPTDAEEAKKELLSDEFGENVSDDDRGTSRADCYPIFVLFTDC